MAAVYPVRFTEILESEIALNQPSHEDLVKRFFANLNMLSELAVIGAVEAYATNQPGVLTPEPTVFQAADGSEITEPTSPLRTIVPTSRFTPDIRNRVLRGANGSTTIGNELGGAATVNLQHNHGGATGNATFAITVEEGVDGYGGPASHFHVIANDLSAAEPLAPAHMKMNFFLKIN